MDSGVHPTLHSEFHHQIIYSKLNLKIEYSPPYAREVCDYGKAQFDPINRTIENFYWNKLFSGHNNHNQVQLFNKKYWIFSDLSSK